jgi:hypothetical protein
MMTILAGFMLLVAFILRLGLTYYAYKQAGTAAIYNRELLMTLLLLAGSLLLLRYGWRTWRPQNNILD